MRIAGNHEKILINRSGKRTTSPYRLPNQDLWGVSIKDDKKTLYKILFMDKKECENFLSRTSDELELIKLPIINESGKSVDEAYFFTLKSMDKFIKHMNKEDLNKINEEAKIVEAKQEMTLEDMVSSYNPDSLGVDDDVEMALEELDAEYNEKISLAEEKAKGLLVSIAEYYLGADLVTTNQYVRFKMQIEQSSLSSLVFQIDVSKKAIYSIIKQIHLGSANVKMYDSLASLQRIILDVNKYQSTLIKDMVADFKMIKEREQEKKNEQESNTVDVENGVIISTPSRKALSEAMKRLKDENK